MKRYGKRIAEKSGKHPFSPLMVWMEYIASHGHSQQHLWDVQTVLTQRGFGSHESVVHQQSVVFINNVRKVLYSNMRTTPRIWSYFLVGVQFLCLITLGWSGPLLATNALLFLIECTSAGLGVWAVITLRPGRFNITPEIATGGKLMLSGPYRFIRHPMYTSLLLASLVLIFDSFSISRACVWIALIATLVVKLLYEERLLSERFPEYERYKQQTKRLVPFLW